MVENFRILPADADRRQTCLHVGHLLIALPWQWADYAQSNRIILLGT
jgi:hypothetical protein